MRAILLLGLSLVISGLLPQTGSADGHGPPTDADPVERVPMPVEKLEVAFEYRDGDLPRKVWVNPRAIVQFLRREDLQTPPEPPVEGARLVATPRGARLWLLPASSPPSPLVADELTAKKRGRFSPALHSEATSGSGLLALPGGITIVFGTDWDEQRIAEFARRHTLGELARLTIGPGWYRASTPPGLVAIERANALLATGEILAATPDFWRPSVLRRR